MQNPSNRGFQKSRCPSRRFYFSEDMAERFEPALVRGRLGGAYRLYGRAALPFRPGMNRFGQVQKGLEWDI